MSDTNAVSFSMLSRAEEIESDKLTTFSELLSANNPSRSNSATTSTNDMLFISANILIYSYASVD